MSLRPTRKVCLLPRAMGRLEGTLAFIPHLSSHYVAALAFILLPMALYRINLG